MSVQTPAEPAFYFECSFGRFRLSYFLPASLLKRMVENDQIKDSVLEDYPDGVDLDCTTADFDEFQDLYGFKPELSADVLRGAFYAMLTSTKDWEGFHGTGFVDAAELERNARIIHRQLGTDELLPEATTEAIPMDAPFETRKERVVMYQARQSRVTDLLKSMHFENVDVSRTINEQRFADVPMSGGKPAAEVFQELQRKRTR